MESKNEESSAKIEVFYFECGKEQQTSDEFECSLCYKVFSSEKSLAGHGQRMHRGNTAYKCGVCSLSFTSRKAVSEHVRLHEVQLTHTTDSVESHHVCPQCGEILKSTGELEHHEKQMHGRVSSSHEKFGRKLQNHGDKHSKSGHDPKSDARTEPLENDEESDLSTCIFCQEEFRVENIVHHYETEHPVEYDNQERACHLCNAVLKNRRDFESHLLEHDRHERDVISSETSHNEQTTSTTSSRPKKTCNFCGLEYSSRNLRRHILMQHTKESSIRKHPCPICEKECYSKTRLEEHLHLHTGEKPYRCDLCEKTFKSRRSLNDHGRIHRGEKPFVCEYCDEGFTHLDGWKYHMRSSHGVNPLQKNKTKS